VSTEPQICHRCGYRAVAPQEERCPRDGLLLIDLAEHERAPRDLYLGTMLGGKYPILGVIGEGGMGAVYRSVQPLLGRVVAIKVILPKTGFQAEEAKERFLREARTIASLDHRSVVTLYDFGVEGDGTLYMVMEYVAGSTLPRWLGDLRPTSAALVQVACDVLDALDAAHEQGIIHRDIKPDNIMVLQQQRRTGSELRVKILDFGLVKLLGSNKAARVTHAGVISGSPHYMSPEQARGAPVDTRSDLYSLGTVLYESLSGRPPFEADNLMRLITMRVENEAPRLGPAAHIPDDLAAVVERAMHRQPDQRYPSAAAMRDALQALDLGSAGDEQVPLPHFLERGGRPASSGRREERGVAPKAARTASGRLRPGSAPGSGVRGGLGSGPGVAQGSGPRVGHGSGPRRGHGSGPGVGHGSGPPVAHRSAPGTGHGSGPRVGQGSGPRVGQGSGPRVGQGSGPRVGQGSGPRVGQGSGPRVGQGSGPVQPWQQAPSADEPPPLPGSPSRPLTPPPRATPGGSAPPAVVASGRFAAPVPVAPPPPLPLATPSGPSGVAPELPTMPQNESPGRTQPAAGARWWLLAAIAVALTSVLLGGGFWSLRISQPRAGGRPPRAPTAARDTPRPKDPRLAAKPPTRRGRHTLRSVPEAQVFDQRGESLGTTPLSLRVQRRAGEEATYQVQAEGYARQVVRLPLDGRPHTRTLWLQRPAPQRPVTPVRRPPGGRGGTKREF